MRTAGLVTEPSKVCLKNIQRVALAIAILLPLLALGCSGSSSPTEPGPVNVAEVEAAVFGLLNQARASEGVVPPLQLDESLSQVARRHSRAMRDEGFFGHIDLNGKTLRDRLEVGNISFRRAAENLVEVNHGTNPALVAHNQLMSSSDHRNNILDPRFTVVGVGVARAGETYWLTQIFIRP